METTEKSQFYPNEYNWWQLEEDCKQCSLPLHMVSGKDLKLCPNCAIDQDNAEIGRWKLRLLKERVMLEERRKLLAEEEKQRRDNFGPVAAGMPL